MVAPPPQAARDPLFERPVFVVCPPRSGSSLLFEALARAPGLYTIGGEAHRLIEQTGTLHPGHRGFDSNQLGVDDAPPVVAAALRRNFLEALRDRDGFAPRQLPVRMLEKTPKNSLRVPFLALIFPEAHFVYLHRDPREVLGSMLDAWQSGRFRTYLQLPGWRGPDWSLVLVPGWRELSGRPLPEIVATQWQRTTEALLDALQARPAASVHAIRYERLLADPQACISGLCGALGLPWDVVLPGQLPHSRYTVSTPAPDKWRRHAAVIEPLLPRLQATIERAEAFVGG